METLRLRTLWGNMKKYQRRDDGEEMLGITV